MTSKNDIIEKIRALLSKAESTTYEAEADAFYAKAQELMLQYAVDEAELEAAGKKREEAIVIRDIIIKRGLAATDARSWFLYKMAPAFNCRAFGWSNTDKWAVAGYESDTQFVELLYLSVNLQCYSAMNREVKEAKKNFTVSQDIEGFCYEHGDYHCKPCSRFSEAAYRRGFAYGYLNRAGERILERYKAKVEEQTESVAIVLIDKGKRVDEWMAERFSFTSGSSKKGRDKKVDYMAGVKGRQAGDSANIGIGEKAVGGSRRELPA